MSESPDGGASVDHENTYLEHARWLFEWHQSRSEGLMTRASAALAFTGVLLALLLQMLARPDLNAGASTWWLLGLCLSCVLVSALASVRTLLTREQQVPAIGQLREQWTDYRKQKGSPSPLRDITENFIVNVDGTAVSPLATAAKAADDRAGWFKVAMVALTAGTGFLALLVVDVAIRA